MDNHGKFPQTRLRRTRQSGFIRELVQENRLNAADLVLPVFVQEGKNTREEVSSMPGVARLSIDLAVQEAQKASDLGIPAIALFPITPEDKKTENGEEALNPDNLICRATQAIKAAVPHLGIITDVALDPYTVHGHDGILENDKILNDPTVEILCKQALNQAEAGADIIAPSDMMDGRVGAIRKALDAQAFEDVMILSYAAKYASRFYGPFRDAIGTREVLNGDKKTYQMNPANRSAAIREVAMDIAEGADMIMVKPGMPYLDIIREIKNTYDVPLSAYQVSGEYAMLYWAAQNNAFDFDAALMESLLSFKRSGVNFILSYGALRAAELIKQ